MDFPHRCPHISCYYNYKYYILEAYPKEKQPNQNHHKTNKYTQIKLLTMTIEYTLFISIGIGYFLIGWLFYFATFPYWERKSLFESLTWMGFIAMITKTRNMQEPGKTYAKISSFILCSAPVILVLGLLILKYFGKWQHFRGLL